MAEKRFIWLSLERQAKSNQYPKEVWGAWT